MSRKEDIFRYVLTNSYSHTNFVDFTREIISGLSLKAYDREIKPYNTFSAYISKYFMIGDFTDPDGNSVGIFSVELYRGESVERARTAQRNFVKSLLENGSYAAALVAFYSSDNDKWRFSFVRMDYEFAKGKIKENLTPARRYSYLVGKGEPCHTAMDRLLPIFMDDSKLPTIDEIEEAFSVEKVTKDFFEAYKEKYLQLADYLEKNEDFTREAKIKGFTTEQFTKKLLSQIVFLYFIQKKGWLGVNAVPKVMTEKEYKNAFFSHGRMSRELVGQVYYQDGDVYRLNGKALQALSDEDETEFSKCVKGQPWGTGPKNFMRMIFENAVKRGQNFFDDCLEPLFYTGLNQDRGENAFFPPLHCRIPFLNGGLFEELDHYDWQYNDFAIPNEIFSNLAEKGREADGILDIFDRYNFTMAEDEPLEKEVAVDPEMLGKVFENLLEVKDRKSKGAFYTPREIVHYMCSESLINYLVVKTGIPEDDIRKFITLGEFYKDEDARRTKYNSETRKYEYDYNKQLEMPASILDFKNGINRLNEIDEYLKSVRVVDPAVGSGAFPLGLLNEIVRARDTLTTYMAISMNGFQRKMLYTQRSQYQLKTQTIKNCIFACDIEPSATDITKLRLWLALVIEDEIGDQDKDDFGEHTKPRKLPNLDCNILCGNSLVDSFEGIRLICNTEALGNSIAGTNISISDKAIEGHINSLIELQDSLYNARTSAEKEEIKKNIQILYDAIIMEQLQVNHIAMRKYSDPEVRHAASKPFILWSLYFPKVFKEHGGFDIAIGNPPYIRERDNKEVFEPILKTQFGKKYHQGKMDYWYYFLHKAIELINDYGSITYITPRYWLNSAGATLLIKRIKEELKIHQIVDIGSLQVFDNVVGYHMITQYIKVGGNELKYKKLVNDITDISAEVDTPNAKIKQLRNDEIITDKYEIIFEQNDSYTNCEQLGNICSVSQGVVEASDKISKKLYAKHPREDTYVGMGIFVLNKDELEALELSECEKNIIVPYLTGKQLHRYEIEENTEFLVYSDKDARNKIANDERYSNIRKHLDNLSEYITSSNAPYGLHRPRKRFYFESTKIIMPSMFGKNDFAIDYDHNYYVGMSFNCVVSDNSDYPIEYILAILNSKFAYNWFYANGKKRGVGVDIGVDKLRSFPIKRCDGAIKQTIVDKVRLINKCYDKTIDDEIDAIVTGLYEND